MTDRPTVLLPVRVLEGESIPEGIPELLASAHVVLLGYHELPDQTAPDQARMQFEGRATRRLEQFRELLEGAGATVDATLAFTHEAQTTIDRTIAERDCLAVLLPNATAPPESVLVAVGGSVGADRLARLVAGLFAGTDVDVTLYHLLEDGENDGDVETLLDGLASRLTAAGLDADAIERRVEHDGTPRRAIANAAEAVDAVVMGESDASLATHVFGLGAEQVAEQFLGPVLVVQRETPGRDDRTDDA